MAGVKTGNTAQYDPFGSTLNSAQPYGAGNSSYGYEGQHQIGTNTDTPNALLQMGARVYDPTTGRFLSLDPVPGGSANNYDYADQNPINNSDLNGDCIRDPGYDCAGVWIAGGASEGGSSCGASSDDSGGAAGAATTGGSFGVADGSVAAMEGVAKSAGAKSLGETVAHAGYGFDGLGTVLSVVVDHANHASMGVTIGHVGGAWIGTFVGAAAGGLVCSESGPGAAVCAIAVGGIAVSAFSVAGGYAGGGIESGIKGGWHWVNSL